MKTRYTALALLLVPVLARSHDLRAERDREELVLRYGHEAEHLTLDAARVKSMRCLDSTGTTELRPRAVVKPKELRVTARCDVLSASFDGGFWSLTPDGEKPLPRSQAPGALKSWASRQYAKWIDRCSARAATIVGDELEIVPAHDLSRVRSGDKITLRVLLEGKPVTGATVSIGHKAIGETDSAGEVRLRVRGKDRETIGAVLRRPLTSADADSLTLEASLSFEVAP